MLRRLLPVSVLTAIAVAAVPAVSSATSIAGPNGKIAFTSARPSIGVPAPNAGDAGARIFVADYPNGTPEQVTTLPPGRGAAPSAELVARPHADRLRGRVRRQLRDLDRRPAHRSPDRIRLRGSGNRPSLVVAGRQRDRLRLEGDLWVKGVSDTSPAQGHADHQHRWHHRGTPGLEPGREHALLQPRVPPFTAGNKATSTGRARRPSAGAEKPVIATTANEWQPSLSPAGKRLCYLRARKSSEAETVRSVSTAS